MKVIEALGLTKSYKGSKNPALNDISLSIDSKQIFTMLGRNGAGKTTFVRICATQLMPSSGRLSVLGHDIVKYPEQGTKPNFCNPSGRQATESVNSLGSCV